MPPAGMRLQHQLSVIASGTMSGGGRSRAMGLVQRDQALPTIQSTCPHCGGPARLLAALDGPTGTASYQLVACTLCGTRERMGMQRKPVMRLPKMLPGLMAKRQRPPRA